jgi:hypothetical protein
LSVGLYENINLISFKNLGSSFKEKGFSYYELGDKISGARTIKGLETVLGHLRWVNPEYGPDFFVGVAAGMVFNSATNNDIEGILGLFRKIPRKYQAYLYKGLGIGLNDSLLNEPVRARKLFESYKPEVAGQYKNDFYKGIGEGIIINAPEICDVKLALNFINQEGEPEYLAHFYEGIGKGLATISNPRWNAFILNSIEEKYHQFVVAGLDEDA